MQHRNPGLLADDDAVGLAQDRGAPGDIEFFGGELHQGVELGVPVLADVEAGIVALEQEQEVLRVGIVADPAIAGDVEIAAVAQIGEMRAEIGLDEAGLDADRPPLLGDRLGRVLVVVRGVEAELDLKRHAAEAGRGEQAFRFVLTLQHGGMAEIELGPLAVIADMRGDHAIGRQHRATPDPVRDELAVDLQRERPPDALVVERWLGAVDDQEIGREIGADPDLVAELVPQVLELVGRDVGGEMQIAGLEAPRRRREVGGRVEDHRIDLHIGRCVEMWVPVEPDMRVRRQLLQHVGAVRDPVLRPRRLLHRHGHAGLVHRQGALMGQEFEQIGRRLLQRDLQRALVWSGDAECFD